MASETPVAAQAAARVAHMRLLVEQLQAIELRLRRGGGEARIEKQHRAGKLTARERISKLLDPDSRFVEIGLLIAYDKYDDQAPAAGVITGFGRIEGHAAVIVANDATVKAGAWWPETITKILRAQEIAMRNRLPIVYLVDRVDAAIDIEGTLDDAVDFRIRMPFLPQFSFDPPIIPQPYHVEIWAEKTTMNDILVPLAQQYRTNVVTGIGDYSATGCRDLYDRAAKSNCPARAGHRSRQTARNCPSL